MVIVRLKGGIGNQLFQFAFGRAVALERKEELYFDLTYLTENPLKFIPRDFKLTFLNDYELIDNLTVLQVNTWYNQGHVAYLTDSFPKTSILAVLHQKETKAVLLDGYYQDEFYFLNHQDYIRREITELLDYHLQISDAAIELRPDTDNHVAVHVRRGDYNLPETLKVHGICDIDYYAEAIQTIKSKLSNPHFYLFSDDVQEINAIFRQLLDPVEMTNISACIKESGLRDKDLIEMAIMSRCKHFIIANSSFSWWTSYLSGHPDKIVVAPQHWYQDKGLSQLAEDLALKSWIRI
jgi:hypothetical protein